MSHVLTSRSVFSGLADKVLTIMDVILHLGAQRTASTTFQAYLDANAEWLLSRRIAAWGPKHTRRRGTLSGVLPGTGETQCAPFGRTYARDRLQTALAATEDSGIDTLIVSDENMLGTVRRNLRQKALYPDTSERTAHFAEAFGKRVKRLVLSIRAIDDYWASAIAFGVARGMRLPKPDDVAELAHSTRGWRDVLNDLHSAFPGVQIAVHRHETHAGVPERKLAAVLPISEAPPMKQAREWVHRGPDLNALRAILKARGAEARVLPHGEGRWMPFSPEQRFALRETYADDLFWLKAGGGGFATLLEDKQDSDQCPWLEMAGQTAAWSGTYKRGHDDDGENGSLAQAG